MSNRPIVEAFNFEPIIRKPEFLWLQALHKAQTEQIYLNMRRALDSARRGNIRIKTNDYVVVEVVNSSALSW